MPRSKLALLLCLACLTLPVQAKEYDGIWFLGFNLKKPLLQDRGVRQAIGSVINKQAVVKLAGEEMVPVSFIPPTMLGYDPDLKLRKLELKESRELMKEAGYKLTDKRLKNLTLLHTDGVKTVAIARQIMADLSQLGMNVNLKQVSFTEEADWVDQLESGKYDLFLMGYKAYTDQLYTDEKPTELDSASLVEPLFKTDGGANFTGYSSDKVDSLVEQLNGLDMALKDERHKKLKAINQELAVDKPIVVLFYIEKL